MYRTLSSPDYNAIWALYTARGIYQSEVDARALVHYLSDPSYSVVGVDDDRGLAGMYVLCFDMGVAGAGAMLRGVTRKGANVIQKLREAAADVAARRGCDTLYFNAVQKVAEYFATIDPGAWQGWERAVVGIGNGVVTTRLRRVCPSS